MGRKNHKPCPRLESKFRRLYSLGKISYVPLFMHRGHAGWHAYSEGRRSAAGVTYPTLYTHKYVHTYLRTLHTYTLYV